MFKHHTALKDESSTGLVTCHLKRLIWEKNLNKNKKAPPKPVDMQERVPSEVMGTCSIAGHWAGPVARSLLFPVTFAQARAETKGSRFLLPCCSSGRGYGPGAMALEQTCGKTCHHKGLWGKEYTDSFTLNIPCALGLWAEYGFLVFSVWI